MKRNINLVLYESSDEDHENIYATPSETRSTCKRKLPKISTSLTVPTPVTDPALHHGRIRTMPYVEGQFAAFVFVPVPLKKDTPLRALLDKAVKHAKGIEPALVCDWLDNAAMHSLHISLTRPIYLRHYQRDDVKRAVKTAAGTICSFTASFSNFATFANDERTRAFLGVEVGAGHRELESLSKTVEPFLKLLHQKEFYSEPRFHASIAWALLVTTDALRIDSSSASKPVAQATPFSCTIPSFPTSLVPDMNAQFGNSLSSSRIGAFEIDRVCVKIGKELFSWPLGKQ